MHALYSCRQTFFKCIPKTNASDYNMNYYFLQVEHTYNGALDTELAQAMFDCDGDVS